MAVIWVVEDDPSIGNGLLRALGDDFDVVLAASLEAANQLTGQPDVVLLDLNLPDGDGLDWCRDVLSEHPTVRVIMLSARDTEMDKVAGLDAGAIDYLAKPFGLAELLARVRAQLRHRHTPQPHNAVVVDAGDIRIDLRARRVWVNTAEVALRAREFDLLARLAHSLGEVVTRDDLMADVWGVHWDASSKTLDVHMAALRRRLGETSADNSRIATVRHVGYRLDP